VLRQNGVSGVQLHHCCLTVLSQSVICRAGGSGFGLRVSESVLIRMLSADRSILLWVWTGAGLCLPLASAVASDLPPRRRVLQRLDLLKKCRRGTKGSTRCSEERGTVAKVLQQVCCRSGGLWCLYFIRKRLYVLEPVASLLVAVACSIPSSSSSVCLPSADHVHRRLCESTP